MICFFEDERKHNKINLGTNKYRGGEMKWEKRPVIDFVWFQRGFDLPKDKFVNGELLVVGSTSILGYHTEAKAKEPGIVTGREKRVALATVLATKPDVLAFDELFFEPGCRDGGSAPGNYQQT